MSIYWNGSQINSAPVAYIRETTTLKIQYITAKKVIR